MAAFVTTLMGGTLISTCPWPEALSVPRAPWRRRSLAWHPVGTHSDSLPGFSQSEPSTRPEVPHFTDSPEKLQLEA